MHDGGPFQAAIIDSTGTQQAAAIMQGPNTYMMTYTSPSSANTFQITALAGGGSITLTQATFKQLKYVPGTTTISLCNQSNDNYRFGFNGKEKDNQWAGIGNSLDYGFRMEDTRIGRFRSTDPLTKKYPWLTPYQFSSNTPVWAIDLDGKEAAVTSSGINWGYIWGSIGVRGNDEAAAKDYTRNVILPAAKHAAVESGKALLMMIPGLEEEGIELEIGEFTVAADATRVDRPFIPEEPIKTPGDTRVRVPNASGVSRATRIHTAKATEFTQTETLSGNSASRAVGDIIRKLKAGEKMEPIKVFEQNGQKYVIDGHHRLEAAKRLGIEVNYESVPAADLPKYNYKNAQEVVHAASEASGNKLNNGIVNKAATSTQ